MHVTVGEVANHFLTLVAPRSLGECDVDHGGLPPELGVLNGKASRACLSSTEEVKMEGYGVGLVL